MPRARMSRGCLGGPECPTLPPSSTLALNCVEIKFGTQRSPSPRSLETQGLRGAQTCTFCCVPVFCFRVFLCCGPFSYTVSDHFVVQDLFWSWYHSRESTIRPSQTWERCSRHSRPWFVWEKEVRFDIPPPDLEPEEILPRLPIPTIRGTA